MNIRQAILKAADQIELRPELFNYGVCEVPRCGTPGCAIGWIGYFLGARSGGDIEYDELAVSATKLMRLPNNDQLVFYKRMDSIETGGNWMNDSVVCARALREYADLHHPVEVLPASISAIFDMTPEQLGRELAKV